MLSRCKPPKDTQDPVLGLSTVDICTTDIYSSIMIDGFKSFPSGHSSCKKKINIFRNCSFTLFIFSLLCRFRISIVLYSGKIEVIWWNGRKFEEIHTKKKKIITNILFNKKHTYKGFCSIFPFLGATLVAISRIEDYRHHWHDVFIGAILGTVCAYFSYRQFYPSLGQDTCHHPFMTRLLYWKAGETNDEQEESRDQNVWMIG